MSLACYSKKSVAHSLLIPDYNNQNKKPHNMRKAYVAAQKVCNPSPCSVRKKSFPILFINQSLAFALSWQVRLTDIWMSNIEVVCVKPVLHELRLGSNCTTSLVQHYCLLPLPLCSCFPRLKLIMCCNKNVVQFDPSLTTGFASPCAFRPFLRSSNLLLLRVCYAIIFSF